MGHEVYCSATRSARADFMGYATKPATEIFQQRNINSAMSPFGVKIRESRDSAEHPNSLAMVLALDETGSMGSIPHHLVKEGLPTIMETIIKKGFPDLQLLFLGIGDHICDTSPLQVGQFETGDEFLDKWLTSLYLEGKGGGNDGESYLLAWYFAGYHTSIDCFEKRGTKGILFTIGDEPTLDHISESSISAIMGPGQYEKFSATALLEKASKMYHVFHIHMKETSSGSRMSVIDGWKQLIRDNLIVAESYEKIPELIANKVIEVYSQKSAHTGNTGNKKDKAEKTEILL